MKIAIFDYDNTLSEGFTRYELGYMMEEQGLIEPGLRNEVEALQQLYEEGDITYNQKFADDKAIFAKYYKSMDYLEVIRFLENEFDLKSRVYSWVSDLFNLLHEKGYIIVVISGSWKFILEEAQKHVEFDTFWGTEFTIDKGVIQEGFDVIMDYEQKEIVAVQLLHKAQHSIGLGDSTADMAFLDKVDHGFMYDPKPDAAKAALESGVTVVDNSDIFQKISAIAQ